MPQTIERDLWCERRLFGSHAISDPVSFVTGFVMLVIFLWLPRIHNKFADVADCPALHLFVLSKASMVILAIGTIIFHAIPYGLPTSLLQQCLVYDALLEHTA
jgi:cytochrome b subunit of formate dehydrogenase